MQKTLQGYKSCRFHRLDVALLRGMYERNPIHPAYEPYFSSSRRLFTTEKDDRDNESIGENMMRNSVRESIENDSSMIPLATNKESAIDIGDRGEVKLSDQGGDSANVSVQSKHSLTFLKNIT
jgi:hypothetical protein